MQVTWEEGWVYLGCAWSLAWLAWSLAQFILLFPWEGIHPAYPVFLQHTGGNDTVEDIDQGLWVCTVYSSTLCILLFEKWGCLKLKASKNGSQWASGQRFQSYSDLVCAFICPQWGKHGFESESLLQEVQNLVETPRHTMRRMHTTLDF